MLENAGECGGCEHGQVRKEGRGLLHELPYYALTMLSLAKGAAFT
jgi:hypothetical protein